MVDNILVETRRNFVDLGPKQNSQRTVYYKSNESRLSWVFPYLRQQSGGIFGVGSDQVFDIFVNTKATRVMLFDNALPNLLLMKALLEAGSVRAEDQGRYPEPEEFFRLFSDKGLLKLSLALSRSLESDEIAIVQQLLTQNQTRNYSKDLIKTELLETESYYDFMRTRSKLPNSDGQPYCWYSDYDRLERVLSAYDQNHITFVCGDLNNSDHMSAASRIAMTSGVDIETIYLSNTERYNHVDRPTSGKITILDFWRNIDLLPTNSQTKIVRTTKDFSLDREPYPYWRSRFNNLYVSWHYNVEDYSHHQSNLKRRPYYGFFGWESVVQCNKSLDTGYSYVSVIKSPQISAADN